MKISDYYIYLYIILSLQAYSIISLFPLKYPYSLYLSDGNIFIIHQKGISIYDHLFTNKTKDVVTFSKKDQIKTSDLSRITTTLEDELLFCLIKDKVYIFNNKGNLLFHNNTLILNDGMKPNYYSLAAIKIDNYLYNYTIFYFLNKNLYRTYYQYNIKSNKNILTSSFSQPFFPYYFIYWDGTRYEERYDFSDDVITCQYMIDKEKNNSLTCFLLMEKENKVKYLFVIYNYSQEEYLTIYKDKDLYFQTNYDYKSVKCIKSVLISSRSKAFVSLYSSFGELKSFIFDINNKNDFGNIRFNQYFKNNNCSTLNYFGFNIYYYKYNGEFINSCLDTNGNLMIEFYSDNLTLYHYKIIKKTKTPLHGYSILYSNFTGEYFFISDEEPFKLLNGDDNDFEYVKNNFDIKDCLTEEEEEEESEKSEEKEESKEFESEEESEEESESTQKPEKSKEIEKTNNSISTGMIIILVLLSSTSLTLIGYLLFIKFKKPKDIHNEDLPAPINN